MGGAGILDVTAKWVAQYEYDALFHFSTLSLDHRPIRSPPAHSPGLKAQG